jgi:hypothetical protein
MTIEECAKDVTKLIMDYPDRPMEPMIADAMRALFQDGPKAVARLSNPFMYESQMFYCGIDLSRLDAYLNAQGREGWKLHTIKRIGNDHFFCVWEKLDYGEKEA